MLSFTLSLKYTILCIVSAFQLSATSQILFYFVRWGRHTDIVYDRQPISVPAVWASREAGSEIW
jgi:hypothetical protein